MSKERAGWIMVKTAGFGGADESWVHPGPSRCGKIEDGISLENNKNGGWVISYADLKRIAKAAQEARK